MKIAVCVKPVPDAAPGAAPVAAPAAAEIRVNGQSMLIRDGLPLIMNPSDESAIEAALRLRENGEVCLITMGNRAMGNVLKGLLSHGADRAVLISDPAMAGSDTFVTAKTLNAALSYLGGFDLILCGRRAIDGETGQVPPELAVFLGIPFVTNVTNLEMNGEGFLSCVRLLEEGEETLRLPLPALVSLCEYSYPLRPVSLVSIKNARVKELTVLNMKALGLCEEECGSAASPTRVRQMTMNGAQVRSGECTTDVRAGARKLAEMVFAAAAPASSEKKTAPQKNPVYNTLPPESLNRKKILIIAEDTSPDSLALCAAGSALSFDMETCVIILANTGADAELFFMAGAGRVWVFDVPELPADDGAIAKAIAGFVRKLSPEINDEASIEVILVSATTRGRAIAPALASELGTGLTADCCSLSMADDGLLIQTRPAYGSQLNAEIVCEKARPQMASVRPGIIPAALLDESRHGKREYIPFTAVCRIKKESFRTFTGAGHLRNAAIVLAAGKGIGSREAFARLGEIASKTGAALAASRCAVDMGYASYSCQVGQTGVVVRPRLYIACGISGSVQHLAGMSGAEKIAAINTDPAAPIFRYADFGIVADWRDVMEIFLGEYQSL